MDLTHADQRLRKTGGSPDFGRKHFLGVKVGLGETGPDIAFCVLETSGHAVAIREESGEGDISNASFLGEVLPRLLDGYDFSSVTISGPLTGETFRTGGNYRVHERALQHPDIPLGARPLVVGDSKIQSMREVSLKIKQACEQAGCSYPSVSQMAARQQGAIAEVFTRLWVAVCLPPTSIAEKPNFRDIVTSYFCCDGQDEGLVDTLERHGLLLDRRAALQFTLSSAEAFLVALAGAFYFHGRASAIGNDDDGSLILPGSDLWRGGWRELFLRAVDAERNQSGSSLLVIDIPRPPIPECDWICFAKPDCTDLALRHNILPLLGEAGSGPQEETPAWQEVLPGQSLLIIETSENGKCTPRAAMLIDGPGFATIDTGVLSDTLSDCDLSTLPTSIPVLNVYVWRDASTFDVQLQRQTKRRLELVAWRELDVLAAARTRSVFTPQEWLEKLEKRRRDTSDSSDVSKSAGEVDVEVGGHASSESLDSYKVAAGITPAVMASESDPSRERAALTYEAVIAFLDANPGTHTFGDVAEGLGIPRSKGGRAVGAMMRAIHNRGLHEYCVRVVNAKTGKHGCDKAGD